MKQNWLFNYCTFVCISVCIKTFKLNVVDGFNLYTKKFDILQGEAGDSGSYFGYSVAINKDSRSSRILVGAPRSNDSSMAGVVRPGGVFSCTAATKFCARVNIDRNTDLETMQFNGRKVTVLHGKNDSWLGGTLHTPSSSSASKFVTCAHKWYNRSSEYYYMQGMCYEVPYDLNPANVWKIPALTDANKTLAEKEWNYAYGGLGMSAHYTENEQNLLLGASGMKEWTGGFVDIRKDNNVKYLINERHYTDKSHKTVLYIGYSATSGKYFGDGLTYFAFGAPRGGMIGKVLFFRAGEPNYDVESPAFVLHGRDEEGKDLPLNSYFGAVLCTVDVNNDGRDDLFVSAPIYSPTVNEDQEIGAVFVYFGSQNTTEFRNSSQILSGTQPYSRFGSAVASLGDINSDTFNDIAVGAPYEDNLRGAIYLYNGYPKGLFPQHSQRVAASSLDTGLSGFGISVASGTDVNSDRVNDVVVGSYLTDKAVVLYGQPVLSVNATLRVRDRNGVDLSFIKADENISVALCLRYSKRECSYVSFDVTVFLDVEKGDKPRLSFLGTHLAESTVEVKVFHNSEECTSQAQFYAKTTDDLLSDVIIKTKYEAKDISCGVVEATVNRFDGRNPDALLLQITKKMAFKNVCPNNVCRTNLTLSTAALYKEVDGYFEIGNDDLQVNVRITKNGDAAYGTFFYLLYPSFLSYKKVDTIISEGNDVTCSLLTSKDNSTDVTGGSDESALSCLAGNPIINDTGVSFNIFFKVPLNLAKNSIRLTMNVSTLSIEQQPEDNSQAVTINFKHNLEADFTCVSDYEDLYIEESKSRYDLNHIYELHNKGPSVLQLAFVNISFPQIQTVDKALLYLNTILVDCKQNCKVDCWFDHITNSPPVSVYYNGQFVKKSSTTPSLTSTLNTNCNTSACSSVSCTVENLQRLNSATFNLRFVLDRGLESLLEDSKSLTIWSSGAVVIDSTDLIRNQSGFYIKLPTTIWKSTPPKESVEWWIIFISVLCGIILIVLIVVILWKVGFFKREKLEEIQKRKAAASDVGKENKKDVKPDQEHTQIEEERKDLFTDSEGGVVDDEQPHGQSEKE